MPTPTKKTVAQFWNPKLTMAVSTITILAAIFAGGLYLDKRWAYAEEFNKFQHDVTVTQVLQQIQALDTQIYYELKRDKIDKVLLEKLEDNKQILLIQYKSLLSNMEKSLE